MRECLCLCLIAFLRDASATLQPGGELWLKTLFDWLGEAGVGWLHGSFAVYNWMLAQTCTVDCVPFSGSFCDELCLADFNCFNIWSTTDIQQRMKIVPTNPSLPILISLSLQIKCKWRAFQWLLLRWIMLSRSDCNCPVKSEVWEMHHLALGLNIWTLKASP